MEHDKRILTPFMLGEYTAKVNTLFSRVRRKARIGLIKSVSQRSCSHFVLNEHIDGFALVPRRLPRGPVAVAHKSPLCCSGRAEYGVT